MSVSESWRNYVESTDEWLQAGALDKHFFVGSSLSDPSDDPEFYMGNRIVDEPLGVGQGFWLFQSLGSFARIKWEIQERMRFDH